MPRTGLVLSWGCRVQGLHVPRREDEMDQSCFCKFPRDREEGGSPQTDRPTEPRTGRASDAEADVARRGWGPSHPPAAPRLGGTVQQGARHGQPRPNPLGGPHPGQCLRVTFNTSGPFLHVRGAGTRPPTAGPSDREASPGDQKQGQKGWAGCQSRSRTIPSVWKQRAMLTKLGMKYSYEQR